VLPSLISEILPVSHEGTGGEDTRPLMSVSRCSRYLLRWSSLESYFLHDLLPAVQAFRFRTSDVPLSLVLTRPCSQRLSKQSRAVDGLVSVCRSALRPVFVPGICRTESRVIEFIEEVHSSKFRACLESTPGNYQTLDPNFCHPQPRNGCTSSVSDSRISKC